MGRRIAKQGAVLRGGGGGADSCGGMQCPGEIALLVNINSRTTNHELRTTKKARFMTRLLLLSSLCKYASAAAFASRALQRSPKSTPVC